MPEFVAVAALGAVPVGGMRAFEIAGREVVVCRTREGIYALDNTCTHAEARMCEGSLKGSRIVCPLHGAAFDVRTGNVLSGPATSSLSSYAARVVDERIEVAISS
jgi:nitrite reductase/ring-hydroxylating ferredoxin subunit